MELKLKQITFPEAIEFNFLELKREIEEKTASYVGLVYSEDQIKDAKKDVAMLRKFTKALSDERIRVKKDLMKPYEEFEGKIKELTGIVDNAISEIDVQIKAYEEQQKQEKSKAIEELWFSLEVIDGRLTLQKIFNEKWLNASVSMKSIQTEMEERIKKFNDDMDTLSNLPEFGFEATEVYKSTLDINKAISEGRRLSEIQKAKAEHEAEMKAMAEEQARLAAEAEAKKQEEREVVKDTNGGVYVQDEDKQGFTYHEPVVSKQWVSFKALLSTEDALALRDFMNSRNIQFEAV